jgi:ACS family glucarate transporter-like MFS transporter
MAASRVIVGLSYIVCLFLGDALWVTIMMCLVAAATDMGNPAFWAYCQDVGGKYVGSVVGWGNMWGNLGAAIAPQLFILIKSYHPDDPQAGWASVFLVCAVVQVIGAVAAMGIDATHPIKMDGGKSPSTSF